MQLVILFIISLSNAYKILVYNPKVAYSHIQFMGTVADTLQAAGHQTVLQPEFTPHVTVNGSRLAKIVTVTPSEESLSLSRIHDNEDYWEDLWNAEFSPRNLIKSSARMLNIIHSSICKNLLKQEKLLEELKNEKFDVAIVELLDFTGIVMTHLLEIQTVIGASSLGILEGTVQKTGLPLLPSFVPASHGISPDSGSFYDRSVNLVYSYYSKWFQESLADAIQILVDKELVNPPNIWEIVSNIPLLLTNSDPLLDFPRPSLSKIIDIGGIGVREPKELSPEFQEILSLRPATVLISFGTIVWSSKMPTIMKESLVKTIDAFPNVTFIWKYESPEEGPALGNLLLVKWFPQNELLADPRVTLFVTHGGIASTYEAAARGVPMLFVPNFGDQMRNARMIERLGFGKILRKSDLRDQKSLQQTLTETLTSQGMRTAAGRTKSLLESRPFPLATVLVKYVELTAKFGQLPSLTPYGRNFSAIQYYNLDVYALFTLTAALILLFFCFLVFRLCFGWEKMKKE